MDKDECVLKNISEKILHMTYKNLNLSFGNGQKSVSFFLYYKHIL